MAEAIVINLRLPEALSKELSLTSENMGVPKNKIFNDAVTAAVGDYDGHCDKPKYVHTCVRLPVETHHAVRSMANEEYLTINTKFVGILADYLGVESCVAEDVDQG